MTMQIINVEKGSPAEAAGKLQKGRIIESINGKVLKEIDPRIILGGSAFHCGWIARVHGDDETWREEWQTFLSQWTD